MAIKKQDAEVVDNTVDLEQEEEGLFDSEVDPEVAKAQSNVVAKAEKQESTSNMPTTQVNLSEEEMEDLEFGFGTFPIITLNGSFECSDDTIDVDDGFECIIQSYKARYIYRVDEENFFYTYYNAKRDSNSPELRVKTSGEGFDDTLEEWKADGLKHEVKKYLEVVVLMKGENEGKVCLLSVSPTSVGRFSGYVAVQLRTLKGLHYTRVVTKVTPGAKIKSKFSFNPWQFEFVREI